MTDLEMDALGAGVSPETIEGAEEDADTPSSTFGGGLLDRATAAALELAADRPWGEIRLRDIARAAGVPFAELYGEAASKDALLDHLSRRLDAEALKSGEADESGDVHDRLFEAMMARLEAMAPYRTVLVALARNREVAFHVLVRLPRTARALLEATGIDTGGARGALRLAGTSRVWARVLQVWRDDEGALNRTMAEIDRQLRGLNTRLSRVGAGF